MTDRETMKLALEALKTADKKIIAGGIESDARLQMKNAITAIRKALEQPEQPYKGIADRMYRETTGRMRINPVTGDIGIGSPSEQPEQEQEQEHESRITSLEVRVAKLERPVTEHEKQLMAGQRDLLRTAPPKREWQGLTDEEIGKAAISAGCDPDFDDGTLVVSVARAIEAKLKEKNT